MCRHLLSLPDLQQNSREPGVAVLLPGLSLYLLVPGAEGTTINVDGEWVRVYKHTC